MSESYADTGILMKSYVEESDSDFAEGTLRALGAPLAFSAIHRLEIPNAIRLKVFRQEIAASQANAAIKAFRSDVEKGLLVLTSAELAAIFLRAEQLSAKHSPRLGTRSLDLLHVAAALESGCKKFASLDIRQRECAKHEKLEIFPNNIPSSSHKNT